MSWSPSIRSSSSSRPAIHPDHPAAALGGASAAIAGLGRHRARLAPARQGGTTRRVDPRHGHERQDHDDPAHRRRCSSPAGCGPRRAATSASPCSTRSATRRGSTCSSSSSRATSCTGSTGTPEGALAPLASVCLNIADDHLDWHGSAEAYRAAKGKVYANTRVACVYNRADVATRELVEDAEVQEGCRAIGFGLDMPGPSDLGVVEDIPGRPRVPRGAALARARARHARGAERVRARDARTASRTSSPPRHSPAPPGSSPPPCADALRELPRRPPPHRAGGRARTASAGSTTPRRPTRTRPTRRCRRSTSVVWIVGGLLKGVDPAPLVERHASRLRGAVIIGIDRSELRAAFQRHAPGVPVVEVDPTETGDVMSAAVRAAAAVARPGDVVLLAPAAASMDQFTDYADRGRRFAEAVGELLGGDRRDDDPSSRRTPRA